VQQEWQNLEAMGGEKSVGLFSHFTWGNLSRRPNGSMRPIAVVHTIHRTPHGTQ